jgi:tRNA(Ile)-lysidine synthase
MELINRVGRTIRRHELAGPGTRVAVALSGGSDSVALAYLLTALEERGALRVAGLAHLNHHLRAEADADEQFCQEVAAALNRPILLERARVGDLAVRERLSIENAAHRARYDFLERARQQFAADVVALGHTRDDQAETFLLRLLRGAGSRGLAAIHPSNGRFVRPLLDCRRAELQAFLDLKGLRYVTDQSNADLRIPRNRVRAELLPFLEERFNPSIVDVLADEAALAREEWQWLDAQAAELSARLCRHTESACRVAVVELNALPAALARLVLHRALVRMAAGRPITFMHVERALELSRAGGVPIDLPGQRLERIGPDVVLTGSLQRSRGRAASNIFEYSLSIPGEVWIPEAGGVLSAELASVSPSEGGLPGPPGHTAFVQLDGGSGPLVVRNRRPGDRFRPIGVGGGKKLQDFFVDRKVARERRDAVPLVVDGSGRIIWVAGHGIDERFRVMDPAQAVVVLRLR